MYVCVHWTFTCKEYGQATPTLNKMGLYKLEMVITVNQEKLSERILSCNTKTIDTSTATDYDIFTSTATVAVYLPARTKLQIMIYSPVQLL